MKSFFTIIMLIPVFCFSQQLPNRSDFQGKSFIWNPAMTGVWDYWDIGVSYRQDWMGFADSPKTMNLNGQFPIRKKNMSVGGNLMVDKTKPINFNSITFSYAYKLKFNKRSRHRSRGQLSLGFLISLSEYHLDASDIVVNELDDELIPFSGSSGLSPNVGAGLFYTSNVRDYESKNSFFFGLAVNQLYPTNVLYGKEVSNLKRSIHGNAFIGIRRVGDNFFIEPSLWLNYAASNNINGKLTIKMERLESFWLALSYAGNRTLSLQIGLILKSAMFKDGSMRIGTLAAHHIGGLKQGLSYEFYAAYRFAN